MSAPVLHVENLGVVTTDPHAHPILHDVAFTLGRGESVGLVGNSGAGKSTLGNALLRLLPRGLAMSRDSVVRLGHDDLLTLDEPALRRVRGRRLAMVFQEPLRALDPAMRIGPLLASALEAHAMARGAEAAERAEAMLAKVGLPDPAAAAHRFPHELSGGMRQRVLLALALLLEPEVLIADEPTTALDPTLQAQLLDLLDALRRDAGTALLLISHDRALVAERCDRVLVLDRGHIVERTTSQAWLGGVTVGAAADTASTDARGRAPIAVVEHATVHFTSRRGLRDRPTAVVRAVEDVSLTLSRGECLGLVGESGCGKTTFARALLGLVPLTAGRVQLRGEDLATRSAAERRRLRRYAQLVPQDAGASLTPERSVGELVREALEVHGLAHGDEARRRTLALLDEVGLPAAYADRYPPTLSTGERQRVAIARALACDPELLVCDEPVANVDSLVRAQLLALLDRLRRERNLALVIISHDFAAVRQLATRIAVMYLGRIVEQADSPALLDAPSMPYAQLLRAAVPTGDPAARRTRTLPLGDIPSPLQQPQGCPFHPRCPHPLKDDRCRSERPNLLARAPDRPDHLVACWHDPLPRTL